MTNDEIKYKIEAIEAQLTSALNDLAVLKKALDGSGRPKSANRQSNAVKQALVKRARHRSKS